MEEQCGRSEEETEAEEEYGADDAMSVVVGVRVDVVVVARQEWKDESGRRWKMKDGS